ncbi:hypothetical protein GCM10007094_27520 [Pseudovibrio japonicus]|uniref:Peptidase MA-like domain-containing protein n=1 Tax=Pseudovibrio japonicus TaxID=366534 RepID=A0ABQ3EIL1_9HYPH|nr:hypothetical protein [Pseudovibrio japonicus]GHB36388.1 hypothetical protein GCM10007094_27520 [Pseudovibrio japonicus]
MRVPKLSLIALLCATAAAAETQPLRILIKPHAYNPTAGMASLILPAKQNLAILQPREQQNNSEAAPLLVSCDGIEKPLDTHETFLSCRQLQWTVTFDNTRTAPYALANQQNLYSPTGWWSLTEWDDIPRFKDMSKIEVCGKAPGMDTQARCHPLPTTNEPPLILTWGNSTRTLTAGQTTLTLFKDDPTGALTEENLPALQQQLEYLQQLLTSERKTPETIDLVWVAIDEKLRQIAGAAGKQAFLANFAVTDTTTTEYSRAKLHWVSAHELFHLLATQPYPLWMSESLAQYYGYKSLQKAGLKAQTPTEQWQGFQQHFPHAATGLYEAHNKVTRENNPSYYPLFYVKGAAFWQAVDEELQKSGSSLDKILPHLNSAEPKGPTLSAVTLDLLKASLSEQVITSLHQQYLH